MAQRCSKIRHCCSIPNARSSQRTLQSLPALASGRGAASLLCCRKIALGFDCCNCRVQRAWLLSSTELCPLAMWQTQSHTQELLRAHQKTRLQPKSRLGAAQALLEEQRTEGMKKRAVLCLGRRLRQMKRSRQHPEEHCYVLAEYSATPLYKLFRIRERLE